MRSALSIVLVVLVFVSGYVCCALWLIGDPKAAEILGFAAVLLVSSLVSKWVKERQA